jgi:drug/metabolite transporter (DMT)-like permease
VVWVVRSSRRDIPALTAALLTGVTIAAYTVVDVFLGKKLGSRRAIASAVVLVGMVLISVG